MKKGAANAFVLHRLLPPKAATATLSASALLNDSGRQALMPRIAVAHGRTIWLRDGRDGGGQPCEERRIGRIGNLAGRDSASQRNAGAITASPRWTSSNIGCIATIEVEIRAMRQCIDSEAGRTGPTAGNSAIEDYWFNVTSASCLNAILSPILELEIACAKFCLFHSSSQR